MKGFKDIIMKVLKNIMMMGFMLFIVMLSKPVMAMELNSFTDIPNFSIVIGDNMYTLDYANDSKNVNQIRDVLVKNKGDVFIKIDDSGWIRNSDGKLVNKEWVDVLTIKFYNDQEIKSIVGQPVKDTSVTLVTSKIEFTSTIIKAGINTATFKYKLLDKNGTDITKTVPASEISAIASVSSSISLEPLTGTGTITFNTSSDAEKLYIVTLLDKVTGAVALLNSKDSEIIKNSDGKNVSVIAFVSNKLTKIGPNSTTFKYKVMNGSGIDITKTIPGSQITASASVSSTITLDPSTATGTIIYNSSADVDKTITISLVDTITGTTGSLEMATSDTVTVWP